MAIPKDRPAKADGRSALYPATKLTANTAEKTQAPSRAGQAGPGVHEEQLFHQCRKILAELDEV